MSDVEKREPEEQANDQTLSDGLPDDLSEVMDFSVYDLPTTIRLIVLSGEHRRIEVKRGTRRGEIRIEAGEIYNAKTNDVEGDEAFFDLLSWTGAVHNDYRHDERTEGNIRIQTNVLLDVLKQDNRQR